MHTLKILSFAVAAIIFALLGCEPAETEKEPAELAGDQAMKSMPAMSERDMSKMIQAVAVLHPTEGNNAHGTVTFAQEEEGIVVCGVFEGLEPGKHGFHIHEFGDCSAGDATSAGGHFNPKSMQHGGPADDVRHAGDLGNIEVGPDGTATYERIDAHLSFSGENSIIGRSVIIHKVEDDFTSQPTGNAGARVACGVIGIAKM